MSAICRTACCVKTQQAVGHDQAERNHQQHIGDIDVDVERVDQVLEQDGNAKIGKLGRDEAKNRERNPAAILKQVRQQIPDHFPVGTVFFA